MTWPQFSAQSPASSKYWTSPTMTFRMWESRNSVVDWGVLAANLKYSCEFPERNSMPDELFNSRIQYSAKWLPLTWRSAGLNVLVSGLKVVPVQADGRKLHFLGIYFELFWSEGARPELQPPRKLRPGAAVCAARRPTMQPAETQVVEVSTRARMINQLPEMS